MAGLGTVFVEMDLDATRFERSLVKIKERGGETAVAVERAWQSLGTKSALLFDVQRKSFEDAYNYIKKSGTATADEVLRAEKTKNQKIKELNKEMIESANGVQSAFTQMFASFTLANIAGTAIRKLAYEVKQFFVDGFNAVEDVKLSTAGLASTIVTFSEKAKTDLAGAYKEAYDYAGQVVLKLEEWDAKTLATGQDLRAMVETMAQSGVILDINNKKQEEGFIAISNAVALLTQGQNHLVQFRQEIRGLMDGSIRDTNRLAVLLDKTIGGNLDKNLAKWKEEGTLIENVGQLLKGFVAGQKDIENTWLAIKSTLETMYHRVLRGMFEPIYKDIIEWGKEISLNFMNQTKESEGLAQSLKVGMYKAWEDIKNIVQSVVNLMQPLIDLLSTILKFTGFILEGWGYILAAITPFTEKMVLTYKELKKLFSTGDIFAFHKAMKENNKDIVDSMIANMEKYHAKINNLNTKKVNAPPAIGGDLTGDKESYGISGKQAKDNYDLLIKQASNYAEEQRREGENELKVFEDLWNKKRDASLEYYNLQAENIEKNIKKEKDKTDAYIELDANYSMQLEKDSSERGKNWENYTNKKLQIENTLYKTIGSLSIQSNETEIKLLQEKYKEYGRYTTNKELLTKAFDAELNAVMEKQLSNAINYYSQLGGYEKKSKELSLQLIEIQKQKYIEMYGDKVAAAKWAENEINKLKRKELESTLDHVKMMSDIVSSFYEMENAQTKKRMKEFQKEQNMREASFEKEQKRIQNEEDGKKKAFEQEQEARKRAFEDIGKHTSEQIKNFEREQQDRATAFETGVEIRTKENEQKKQDFVDEQNRKEEEAKAQAGRATTLFRMTQAAAIGEATINAMVALTKTTAQTGIFAPLFVPLVYATLAMSIAKIAAQKPPSYDEGGISHAKGYYQTGNIDEAHIPLKNGKVPVQINKETVTNNTEQVTPIQIYIDSDLIIDRLMSKSKYGSKKLMVKRGVL